MVKIWDSDVAKSRSMLHRTKDGLCGGVVTKWFVVCYKFRSPLRISARKLTIPGAILTIGHRNS
jgi:hypothetical protein